MLEFFSAYKNYPYSIPPRIRFFNLFRWFFKYGFLHDLLVFQLARGKKFWRRMIPPVYFHSPHSLKNVIRDDVSLTLDLSRIIDHEIYFYTLHEPAWQNLFKLIKPDFVIFDVGANIGYLTLNFARLCPDGKVFAFEPDSENFLSLKRNVNQNTFNNILLHKMALGEKCEKKILFKLEIHNPGRNRILPDQSKNKISQEAVDVVTLDSIAYQRNVSRVDLLKIDVEGFELFVIKGGVNFIRRFRPLLFVEVAAANLEMQNLSTSQLMDYIENLNYTLVDARTMKPVDKSIQNLHTDVLCFPNTDLS